MDTTGKDTRKVLMSVQLHVHAIAVYSTSNTCSHLPSLKHVCLLRFILWPVRMAQTFLGCETTPLSLILLPKVAIVV